MKSKTHNVGLNVKPNPLKYMSLTMFLKDSTTEPMSVAQNQRWSRKLKPPSTAGRFGLTERNQRRSFNLLSFQPSFLAYFGVKSWSAQSP
jgi:hypothetical protein